MNVRLRMYQVLLFKLRRRLCKGLWMLVNCCSIVGYGWSDTTKYWVKGRGEVAYNGPVILVSSSFLLQKFPSPTRLSMVNTHKLFRSLGVQLYFHKCVSFTLAGRCLRLIQCSETEVLSLTVRLLLSSLKVTTCWFNEVEVLANVSVMSKSINPEPRSPTTKRDRVRSGS